MLGNWHDTIFKVKSCIHKVVSYNFEFFQLSLKEMGLIYNPTKGARKCLLSHTLASITPTVWSLLTWHGRQCLLLLICIFLIITKTKHFSDFKPIFLLIRQAQVLIGFYLSFWFVKSTSNNKDIIFCVCHSSCKYVTSLIFNKILLL
jgi:hypothetical protein